MMMAGAQTHPALFCQARGEDRASETTERSAQAGRARPSEPQERASETTERARQAVRVADIRPNCGVRGKRANTLATFCGELQS